MATMINNNAQMIFLGTELKLNVNIQPIDDLSMADYDFKVEVYVSPNKSVIIEKDNAIKVDDDNYLILVDTNEIGAGSVKCKVTALIPDADFSDLLRTEIVAINTGINVVKSI